MRTNGLVAEREAKFDVDRDYDPPDLRHLTGGTERLPEQRLRTCYFDTADRRLARLGITLRHRSEETDRGDDGTWTLKVPESADRAFLYRSELSWTGPSTTIPPEALGILRGLVRRSPLQPLVELDTTRRRLLLYRSGRASLLGELDDDLVRVVGGSNDGLSFRQIELELGGSDRSEADRVLKALRRSGANPSGRSKLSIAVGDRSASGPDGKGKKRRRERLEDTITGALRAGLERLLSHDYRLRIEPDQPHAEDIHQARVAARRLRSDLRTFAPVLDPVWLGHIRDDLSWVGTVLGRVRDIDVRAGNLAAQSLELGAESLELAELQQTFASDRAEAVAEVRQALDSDRYIDLLDRLDAAIHALPTLRGAALPDRLKYRADSRAARVLPVLVGDQWKSLRRKVAKAGRAPDDNDLHKIRIRAKRLRYAAETAAPVVGKPAVRTAARAEAIQTVLGDLHDTVTTEAWLRQYASGRTPAEAMTAGMLTREQQIRREKLRRQWRREWSKLQRRKNLSWMTK